MTTQRKGNVGNNRVFFSRFAGWDCWAAEWTNGGTSWRSGGDSWRRARARVWRPAWTSRGRRGGANKGGLKAFFCVWGGGRDSLSIQFIGLVALSNSWISIIPWIFQKWNIAFKKKVYRNALMPGFNALMWGFLWGFNEESVMETLFEIWSF